MKETKLLTQLEFKDSDFETSERIADYLGFKGNHAYASTSDLIGLFCMVDAEQYARGKRGGCIIKTKEFGFMFVQIMEDIGFEEVRT